MAAISPTPRQAPWRLSWKSVHHKLQPSSRNADELDSQIYAIGALVHLLAITIIRLSVLVFFLDLFRIDPAFCRVTYAVAGINITLFVALFVSELTVCGPISTYWENPRVCWKDSMSLQITFAAVAMALDLAVVVLPIPVVLKMHLSPRKKLKIIGIFAVGFL